MNIIIVPDYIQSIRGRRYFMADILASKGHEVHYMIWDDPYNLKGRALARHLLTSLFPHNYEYGRLHVHKVVRLPYYWPYINGILFKSQIKRLFKKVNGDIIFTETYTNETELPKDLPFIYDLADDYSAPGDLYGGPIYKLAFKLLDIHGVMARQCKNALAVTAVSDMLVDFAKQYNDLVLKIPSAVEKDVISEVLSDKSIRLTNDHSMIYVGRFGQWSRPVETMQAVVELHGEFPDIDLTMIGPGVETENIKAFIKEHRAEDFIHFLGPIYDARMKFAHIKRSSIGLSISQKDRFRDSAHPVKVLEYSTMGKKVVSTNLTEVEALGFPNIFVFSDSEKGSGLKAAMRQALLEKAGKKAYAQVSERVLRDYNWDKLTDDLLHLIEKVKNK